jgi:hypothetical protein
MLGSWLTRPSNGQQSSSSTTSASSSIVEARSMTNPCMACGPTFAGMTHSVPANSSRPPAVRLTKGTITKVPLKDQSAFRERAHSRR